MEWEKHVVSQVSFRNWCRHCVAGRRIERLHLGTKGAELDEQPYSTLTSPAMRRRCWWRKKGCRAWSSRWPSRGRARVTCTRSSSSPRPARERDWEDKAAEAQLPPPPAGSGHARRVHLEHGDFIERGLSVSCPVCRANKPCAQGAGPLPGVCLARMGDALGSGKRRLDIAVDRTKGDSRQNESDLAERPRTITAMEFVDWDGGHRILDIRVDLRGGESPRSGEGLATSVEATTSADEVGAPWRRGHVFNVGPLPGRVT